MLGPILLTYVIVTAIALVAVNADLHDRHNNYRRNDKAKKLGAKFTHPEVSALAVLWPIIGPLFVLYGTVSAAAKIVRGEYFADELEPSLSRKQKRDLAFEARRVELQERALTAQREWAALVAAEEPVQASKIVVR